MTGTPAPDWLAELQARFGAALRTPLDRTTGTLQANTSAYDAAILADLRDRPSARAAERLAVYNRQYWFRLFSVMQAAFPMTSRLLGPWELNGYAARFLSAHPPRSWDLGDAPDGFERFLAEAIEPGDDAAAVIEAAQIDAVWRSVSRAPLAAPFRPQIEDASRLLRARLTLSPAAALICEHYPLLELRAQIVEAPDHGSVATPPPLSEPRWWLLLCEPLGIRRLALEPREGELLSLLTRHTVQDALAHLEGACPREERAGLPERTRRWLTRSVAVGLWKGAEPGDD